MKALGVAGLVLWAVGFWAGVGVLACGGREAVEPAGEPADVRVEVRFPVDPAIISRMAVMDAEATERVEMMRLSRLGPDGRLTSEESANRIAALEQEYLSEEGEVLSGNRLLRPLTDDERAYLIERDRKGEGFERGLQVLGLLVEAPTEQPSD